VHNKGEVIDGEKLSSSGSDSDPSADEMDVRFDSS
jgi:hypothetical protein